MPSMLENVSIWWSVLSGSAMAVVIAGFGCALLWLLLQTGTKDKILIHTETEWVADLGSDRASAFKTFDGSWVWRVKCATGSASSLPQAIEEARKALCKDGE